MQIKIEGVVSSVYPDDINTDDIIPAWTLQESTDRAFFAQYAFANYDSEFIKRCKKNSANIIVAGKNFGCGSSREQAIYALQENNVQCVIAPSFPDIFYRNALNNGLTLVTLPSCEQLKMGHKVAVDLQKKQITIGKKTVSFTMSQDEANIFMYGGKMGSVRNTLTSQLRLTKQPKSYYKKQKYTISHAQTIVEKMVSDHMHHAVYAGDTIEKLPIDVLFFNEVIGPPAIYYFHEQFDDVFKKEKVKPRVFDSKKIFFIPDHTVPSSSLAVSDGITRMEQFAQQQKVQCYKEGDGIEHIVLIEGGYIVPGEIILGTDSHTDTNGALNTLAFGIGTTDGSYALATGYLYDFSVPTTIRFNLHGALKGGVFAKDIILSLIGTLGVDGAAKRVIEFGGPALKHISIEGRMTMTNMAVEMGARTGIFEYDQVTKQYLQGRAQFPFKTYAPDPGCLYEKSIDVDLSAIEPCVAFPHKPGNVTPINDIKNYMKRSQKSTKVDLAKVKTLRITDAFLGACTNGRYEDFVVAAQILKGRKVADHVNFVAIPASRAIYQKLVKNRILDIFIDAGVNVESANCGPCFGKHMGIIGRDAQMISSSNRNYIGRMGSKDSNIFLASPATVAASAVAGEITDPRKYL